MNFDDIKAKLAEALETGLHDDATARLKKLVRNLTDEIESTLEWHFKDATAPALVAFVEDMAKRTVEAIMNGNEQEMRRYLGCEKGCWTGRSDSPNFGRAREPHEWHSVIHGRLFETGAIELRKRIVEAHRDLIASERILDLEDQVKSLVAQVNKANEEKERMFERLREAQRP